MVQKQILITKNTKIIKKFLLKGSETYDLDLILIHQAPKIKSEVLIKGVLLDSAKAKITVNLKIEGKAIDTETFFRCQILNLGENSRAEVFPYLEISQNQLKAGHAVSISRIRENEMFYLKSRGLTDETAKELIIEGFLK